ncbi:hypothetical protein GJ496_009927 [Pomphorhynchus laevis]|nr:hypothetical protein GJ496_009927 [Pomphorhynchus laevis]
MASNIHVYEEQLQTFCLLHVKRDHIVNYMAKNGFTALHIAAHYGNVEVAELLIYRNADVNFPARHGITPLHVAAKCGKDNMVRLLLNHNADVDCKTQIQAIKASQQSKTEPFPLPPTIIKQNSTTDYTGNISSNLVAIKHFGNTDRSTTCF